MRVFLRFLLILGVLFLLFRYLLAILFPRARGKTVEGMARLRRSSIADDRIQDAHFKDIPKE